MVVLNAFGEAARKLAAADADDPKAPKQVANWLRKQKLAFDCDCGRHRYFLRYVATIGGFAAGRQEWGYPKIRNPGLKGVACKHVLRVMAELESSGLVLRFLQRHMDKLRAAGGARARLTAAQADAEQAAGRPARAIKSSVQRQQDARKARERSAARAAAATAQRLTQQQPLAKKAAATRRIEAALAAGTIGKAELETLRKWMSDAQIAHAIGKEQETANA